MAICANPECKNEFKPKNNKHSYCSEKCRPSYLKSRPYIKHEPYDLICVICKKPFKSPNKASRFCSNDCIYAYTKNKNLPIEYAHLTKCPLLIQCNRLSGIDCKDRDFRLCFLFKNVVSEKKLRAKS